jgi:hypothetical protein
MNSFRKFLFICFLAAGTAASAQDSGIPSESPDFKVFPNPNQSTTDTYVSLQGFKTDNLLVVVYDMLGREIYSKVELMENEGFLFTISSDGHRLSPGIYLITASANDKVFQQKLIVK